MLQRLRQMFGFTTLLALLALMPLALAQSSTSQSQSAASSGSNTNSASRTGSVSASGGNSTSARPTATTFVTFSVSSSCRGRLCEMGLQGPLLAVWHAKRHRFLHDDSDVECKLIAPFVYTSFIDHTYPPEHASYRCRQYLIAGAHDATYHLDDARGWRCRSRINGNGA